MAPLSFLPSFPSPPLFSLLFDVEWFEEEVEEDLGVVESELEVAEDEWEVEEEPEEAEVVSLCIWLV